MQHNHIAFLRSQNAILAVLILALVAQLPHAADVFRLIVHGAGIGAIVHSYCFAIALELAVLLFVVQGRHRESYGFAAASVAMNLSYYHLHDVQLFSMAALPALLVSVALPVAIARYSHVVADAPEEEPVQVEVATPDVTVQPENVQPHDAPVHPESVQADPDATAEQKHRALLLHSEGLSHSQIGHELGVHRNTVGKWLKSANGYNGA